MGEQDTLASGNEGKGQRMPEPEAPPLLSCCSHTIGHLCPILMPWGRTNFIWFPLLTAEGIPHPRYWKTEMQGRGPCSWEPGTGSPRHSSTIHEAGLGSKVVSESKVCSEWRGGVGSDDRGCPTPPSASFRSSCWKLRVSSGLLDAVAGNQVAAYCKSGVDAPRYTLRSERVDWTSLAGMVSRCSCWYAA